MQSKLLCLFLFPILLFAQSNSWDGKGIKPNSKFRTLNFFINVIYDVRDTLQDKFPSGTWAQATIEGVNNQSIPGYLMNLGFMDTLYTSQNTGILTKSFGESSFDSLQIVGGFMVINIKESSILAHGPFSISNIAKASVQLINNNGGLQTLHGRNQISDYDFEGNDTIYFTNTMIRNITTDYGGLSSGHGGGGNSLGTDSLKIVNQFYSFSRKGSIQCIGSGDLSLRPANVIRHEITHSLLGVNSFHTSGGNHRGSSEHMPFLSLQSGFGLFGGVGLSSCNGYERWRLHWKHPNAPDYITARSLSNTTYVMSDIKKEDGNKSFVLRDFVTYGDAIRIMLPYKDSPEASNQYIWLENHQVGRNNKLDFLDYSNFVFYTCRPSGMPGIYAYYQVGRDILSGTLNDVWPVDERDNLKIIPAEGYFNYSIVVEQNKLNCVNYQWHDYYHVRSDENPFCGYQDQEIQMHPASNDIILNLSHQKPMWRKRIGANFIDSLVSAGDNRDAFSTHSKINLSTNPSTCNAKAFYNFLKSDGTCNYTAHSYRNNETTYLSGLSIEMIPQLDNTFRVNIRWNDYNITNSANWTGKISLKEKAILESGNNIYLKQNKTPAQFTKDNQSGYFAKTSLFVCEFDSEFLQESNTSFDVQDKSKILIKSGAKYTILQGADLTIKSGCTLEVEDCGVLEIEGRLIVENGANIIFHPNTVIIMQDINTNIVYPGNVQMLIYPYIWISPIMSGNLSINSPIVFNNNIVVPSGSILTVNSTLQMGAECKISVQPGGKLIVNGKITNSCPDRLWQGVCVVGNSSLSQTSQNQGVIELNRGAILENAKNAIGTYHLEPDGSSPGATTGGIVKANGAIFKNNRRSVEFLKYPPDGTSPIPQNVSYFYNCSFILDDNNIVLTSHYNYFNQLTMWAVTGVKIQGCKFENYITSMPDRKHAIYSIDAGYIVDEYAPNTYCQNCECPRVNPSIFKGFNQAIESLYEGKQYAITIDRSEFANNTTGILFRGKNNFQLSRLYMPLATNYSNNPTGIYMDQCTEYKIEGDSIFSNGNDLSIGIKVNRAGTNENKIYRNVIHNTRYGIRVTEEIPINDEEVYRSFPLTGLQFVCNDLNNNFYDISVGVNGKIRSTQGSAFQGADNLFSLLGPYNFIANEPVNYYRDLSVPRKTPNYVSGGFSINNATRNTCQNTLCNSIIDKGSSQPRSSKSSLEEYRKLNKIYSEMIVFFNHKGYDIILNDYYNGIIENEELLKEAINYHEAILDITAQMADISNETLFALKTDSIIDLYQIRDWYDEIYTLKAKYALSETYCQLGKFEEGYNTLILIPKMYHLNEEETIEHNNYVSLFIFKNKIRENDRTIADLKEDEIEQLIYFATASNGLSSIMAQNILCFFYGICFEKEEYFEDKVIRELDDEMINNQEFVASVNSTITQKNVIVYPNPGKNNITVVSDIESCQFELIDMIGKILISQKIYSGYNSINTSFLKQGLYIYRTYVDGKIISGKWVKM